MAEIKEKQGPRNSNALLQENDAVKAQKIEEIIKVKPEDLTEEDIRLLTENLAEHTFLPENVIAGSVRMRIKDAMKPVGQKLDQFGLTMAGKILQKLNSAVWGGYTKKEINASIANRFRKMTEEGLLMGVKVDGKIVAVAGLKEHGKMPDGRSLYEIGKVSTLPQYQGRKLGTKVMDAAIAHFLETFPGMPLCTASMNPKVQKHFRSLGWKEVPWTDQSDFGIILNGKKPGKDDQVEWQREWAKMGELGYISFFYDPQEHR